METALAFAGWTAFAILILSGLLLNTVGLFGNWIICGAVVGAWALTGFEHFDPWWITGMIALAATGEVLELLMSGYGAKKFGGSTGSMWAALVGCIGGAIIGSPIFPVVGTLIGACLGAFLAAAGYEFLRHGKEVHASLWTGFGAGMGKLAGIAAKFTCGILILLAAFLSF